MGAQGHDGLAVPGRVVLAREQAFSIGLLQIEPRLRQVRFGEQQLTLEPRVMQVLVALARVGGEVVTRDELVEYCWDRRAVGDDSINRALSRIRRLFGTACVPFRIETIPKVGYRLIERDGRSLGTPLQSRPAADRSAPVGRRAILAGVAAATLGTAAGSIFLARRALDDAVPREARLLYERAEAMNSTATQLTDGLVIPLLEEAVRIAPQFGDAWGALALQYRAEIERDPARRSDYEARLRAAVTQARRYSPGNPDAEAAVVLPGEHFGRWTTIEPVYRRLVARHPDYGSAHHSLGVFLMDVGRWSDAVEPLLTARRLKPLSPIAAYQLTVALWGAGRIADADDEIANAMRLWPRHSAIWQTRIKLLTLTGRARAALRLLEDSSRLPLDHVGDFTTRIRVTATALLSRRADDVSAALAMMERSGVSLPDAIYCAAMGQVSVALDMLEGIFFGTGAWGRFQEAPRTTHPLFQPHARPLWREPRYDQLLSAIRLEQYWRASGTQPDYRRFG